MLKTVERLFEARFETWSENSPKSQGFDAYCRIAMFFSCTMRFHLRKNLQHGKTFKRGASCGSHDFLGSARGWGLTLRWFFDWNLVDSLRFLEVMHVTHIEQAPTSDLFFGCFLVQPLNGSIFVPKENGCTFKQNLSNVLWWSGPNYCGLAWLEDYFEDISFLQSMDK